MQHLLPLALANGKPLTSKTALATLQKMWLKPMLRYIIFRWLKPTAIGELSKMHQILPLALANGKRPTIKMALATLQKNVAKAAVSLYHIPFAKANGNMRTL